MYVVFLSTFFFLNQKSLILLFLCDQIKNERVGFGHVNACGRIQQMQYREGGMAVQKGRAHKKLALALLRLAR
jgi:hypothetical protein